jgi:hypothetical protein
MLTQSPYVCWSLSLIGIYVYIRGKQRSSERLLFNKNKNQNQRFSYIKARTFQRNDDIHFVLYQHAYLDFYSASSLRQTNVTPPLLIEVPLPRPER